MCCCVYMRVHVQLCEVCSSISSKLHFKSFNMRIVITHVCIMCYMCVCVCVRVCMCVRVCAENDIIEACTTKLQSVHVYDDY